MARILTSVREVVEALGGVSTLAKECQVVETAVWNWIGSNRFPARTYALMHDMLAEKSAAAPDVLWGMTRRISRHQPEMAA